MEIGKLIEQLTERARLAAMNEDSANAELFERAAETIRLLLEIAREESNRKYKRMIDDLNKKEE